MPEPVSLIRQPVYTPILEQLLRERRPALIAAQNDVVEAQAHVEAAMGGAW